MAAGLIFAFFSGFLSLDFVQKKFKKSDFLSELLFLPLFAILAIGLIALFFGISQEYDTIFPTDLGELLTAVLFTGIIFFVSTFETSRLVLFSSILLGAAACSFFMPPEFLVFQGALPLVADRICLILLWALFSYCCQYLNIFEALFSLQSLTVSTGIFILFLLGGVSALVGAYALFLTGLFAALLSLGWPPSKINISHGSAQALGFALAWLMVKTCGEGSSASVLIFSAVFVLEMLFAFAKKLLPFSPKNIYQNTHFYQMTTVKLSGSSICINLVKIAALMVILGSFQIYSPNSFSIPVFSFAIAAWLINRLAAWEPKEEEPVKTKKTKKAKK